MEKQMKRVEEKIRENERKTRGNSGRRGELNEK